MEKRQTKMNIGRPDLDTDGLRRAFAFDLGEAITLASSEIRDVTDLIEERPAMVFAIALMEKCSRLVMAMRELVDLDLDDCASALTRSVVDHVSLGLWLLDDPDAHFDLAVGDYRKHLEKMAKLEPIPNAEGLRRFDQLMKSILGHTQNRTMPVFDERAYGRTPEMRALYRELSGDIHSNFGVALGALDPKDDRLILNDRSRPGSGIMPVLMAAILTCYLSREIHRVMKWGFEEDHEGVIGSLKSLVNPSFDYFEMWHDRKDDAT